MAASCGLPVSTLTAHRLTKQFGQTTALHDITIEIYTGETVGLIGPNGAGKSTFMKLIAGSLRPTSGSLSVAHGASGGLPARRLGFVFDPDGIPGMWHTRSYLRYEAVCAKTSRSEFDTVIDRFELADVLRRRVGTLSTGQRKRVVLAGASMASPGLLLLDEPTNGLDIDSIRWLRALAEDRKARGLTTIVSSHPLAELMQMVERIVVIRTTLRFDGDQERYSSGELSTLEQRYYDLTEAAI